MVAFFHSSGMSLILIQAHIKLKITSCNSSATFLIISYEILDGPAALPLGRSFTVSIHSSQVGCSIKYSYIFPFISSFGLYCSNQILFSFLSRFLFVFTAPATVWKCLFVSLLISSSSVKRNSWLLISL